jgi:uncharacterized repeat protein (TIGR01451 family)
VDNDPLLTILNTVVVTPIDLINPLNNIATETTTVTGGTGILPTADLVLTKTASPNPVGVGEPLIYTLTVHNAGPGSATGVVLIDALADILDLDPVNDVHPTQGSCSVLSGLVTCALGTLANGEDATVMIEVKPSHSGLRVNAAAVVSASLDLTLANNATDVSTNVNPGGPGGTCTILGTPDDDVLIGTAGDDVICGLAGNDVLRGLGGNDILRGGYGNDLLNGGLGNDILRGSAGDDILRGWPGNDVLNGGRDDDVLNGGRGNDILRGWSGDDILRGWPGSDVLNGGRGNDLLSGGRGNDVLRGGYGNDILRGGYGIDILNGGPGADILNGGPGNDLLRGGYGNDILRGWSGNDLLNGGPGMDFLNGGTGRDRCVRPGQDIVRSCEL